MGVLFVCDVHIPPALAKHLRTKGYDAVHTFDIGLNQADDADIWRYSAERDAIIITKDSDFIQLNAYRPGPRVILVRLGNCSNAVLIRRFEESLARILLHFEAGNRVVELA